MPHVNAVSPARALDRPMVHREYGRLTTAQRHDLGPRLHARTLLGEHQLAAGEVRSRLGQQDHDLQREHMLAIEILMQAVVVTGAVAKEKRRRPCLTCIVATLDEVGMLLGIADMCEDSCGLGFLWRWLRLRR